MSGGSYNYAYRQIEDISINANTPERRAFAAHLKKVAKAMHDIEWVDSNDMGPGDESAAIRACLMPGDVLAQTIEMARKAQDDLRLELELADVPQDGVGK